MGCGVPEWVERDFRGYLECEILAHGFARARCEDCRRERLIAFSCKGRGICPSCNARRMCEVADHLTDHVLPHVPIRQWVLSVPKRLRPYLHHDMRVAGAVLQIFLRAIRTTLRHRSPRAPADAQLGAVSFLHRFGSSLNVHPHYHLIVLDSTPPLESPESRLLYRFPKPGINGRTELALTPLELLECLANFVPPPRVHRHRYHGVLAPNARLRPRVVVFGRPERVAEAPVPEGDATSPAPLLSRGSHRR